MTPVLEPFSGLVLSAIGLAFLALEVFFASFYLLWFGFGFLAVAALSAGVAFGDGMYQIALATVLAVVLLLAFAKRLRALLKKSEKEIRDDFLNETGKGVIKEGMVFYKGTLWRFEPPLPDLKDGDEVTVLKAHKSIATIAKP
ncbi:MAG: NfeD family protein [Helicobacteraceae bacterium]